MTPDTQYYRAHLARTAWPRCRYRLQREIRDTSADAPAVFRVLNGAREPLGTLTVTATEAFYGGYASPELQEAIAAVRHALAEARETRG